MRVFIAGPIGSGKSTLAQKIGHIVGAPVHALDEINWIRGVHGSTRRPMDEKLSLLRDVANTQCWVIEGVQFKWADTAIERADMIFVIETSPLMNHYLILKRFARQCLRLERAPYRPTLGTLMQAWGWNADYRRSERQLLLAKLAPYRKKLFVVSHPEEALALVLRRERAMR